MNNTSFLPEDYLTQRVERRTNLISLCLFGVVMIAVMGAFFVTNRQARVVKQRQETINTDYQHASMQIQELTQLEKQRQEMLNKADLAAALVERVPRSILLAELINRMPDRLALLAFEIKSEKVKPPAAAPGPKDKDGRLVAPAKPERAKTKSEAGDTVAPKVEPTRYDVTISMLGVAPTDLEVSKYLTELNTYSLIKGATLEFSEQREVQGRTMRQFKIVMILDPAADVRRIDPLIVPRIKNPMSDEIQLNPGPISKITPAQPRGAEGH